MKSMKNIKLTTAQLNDLIEFLGRTPMTGFKEAAAMMGIIKATQEAVRDETKRKDLVARAFDEKEEKKVNKQLK